MSIGVSGGQPNERSSGFFRGIKEMEKILEDISKLKIAYHKREGTELEKVLDIWREINFLQDEQRETLMCHFSSMLRFFTGNGIQPRTFSDHIFRDHCLALLREVDAYKALNGVNQYLGRAQILKRSTGEASSSRTTNIGVAGDGPIGEGSGRSGGGLSDSTIQPPVEDHVAVAIETLAANSFSLGTTATRNTSPGHISMNIDMGDGRRRDQEPKMKEFRTFAYVTVPLFITIQVSLLSANKRQPEVLFRSCGSLVTGATFCSIGMLFLVLMGPSSQRALIFLKMLQLLIIGLMFVAAILVFTLL